MRSPRAVLATLDQGRPHIVPCVFAVLSDSTIVSAVDQKPKSTRRLKRIRNIEADRRVSLLVDHYDDDWSKLWWVRFDGVASVSDTAPEGALASLQGKYAQYRNNPPLGPWISVEVTSVTTWSGEPET